MLLQNPANAPTVIGIRLVGLNPEVGRKLLLSLVVAVVLVAGGRLLGGLAQRVFPGGRHSRVGFWVRQGIHLVMAAALVLVLLSIWFDDPTRLTTVLGLVSAGIAVALQRVVTSFAAYLILLRGRVFSPGDRVVIGGVRGDVVQLGFTQTTVMEMGEAPGEQKDDPSMWVRARQYTGRLVRVTNDKIFESPVYNYTREFPFLWDEISIPIRYDADRARAERILVEAARAHTAELMVESAPALERLKRRYPLRERSTVEPQIFLRLTDNWIELTVRFIAPELGARMLKDQISRDVLKHFEEAGIGIASATYEIVGVPTLRVESLGNTTNA